MPIDIEHDDIATALQKLKARENTLRQIEAISGMGSWEIDLKTRKSIWSDQSYKIYGEDKETTEPTLELFLSHIVPQDLEYVQEKIHEGITSGEVTTIICRIKKTNGDIATLSVNGQLIYDKENRPLKLVGTTQDISEQVALKEHTKELSKLIEYSSNEVYIVDLQTLDYIYVNQGATKALGYTSEELLSMNVRDINPHLGEKELLRIKKILIHTKRALNRTIHRRKDGSCYHVQSYLHTIEYKQKKCYVIFDVDISQTIELEFQQKKQARILDYIHDSIIATDTEGSIVSWNRGSVNLFGYTAKEMLGKHILNTYDKENEYTLQELFSSLDTKKSLEIEAYMLKKDGDRVICDISLSISKDENGEIDGYVGYIQDISKQKEIQLLLEAQTDQLKHQAHYDMLTSLPNRALFKDRLSQAIVTSKRNQEKFALLFIDLDQFKKINDSLGHNIGDEVLVEAAKRLSSTIREEDTLARLGGDEFTIILKDIQNPQNVPTVADKIIKVMKEALHIKSHNLYITASIGVSIYPNDATDDANLIKYADVAMYKAKDEGRNNYQFYSADMTTQAFEHVVMESSLQIAIKEEQFVVYFQPQFEVSTEKLVGMEALVRWKHPTLGLVPPAQFIPIAEETGLIIEIDRLVMKLAMAQFSSWYERGLHPGLLSLNLAMRQLNEDDFLDYLSNTMDDNNFQVEWLELEVTEGQVMQNPELSIQKLNKIHKHGIAIAIDDFGTGYSSLAYLKKLPLDKLKIDQSFVRDIPEDEDDMAITKAIIALGKSLNLTLIAEGVETQEQKDFLSSNGCELIQGYFYSPPVGAEDIEKFLEV